MPDKLLTTRELVDMLQLDRVTIYKMVKDGELPSLRVGGQWNWLIWNLIIACNASPIE